MELWVTPAKSFLYVFRWGISIFSVCKEVEIVIYVLVLSAVQESSCHLQGLCAIQCMKKQRPPTFLIWYFWASSWPPFPCAQRHSSAHEVLPWCLLEHWFGLWPLLMTILIVMKFKVRAARCKAPSLIFTFAAIENSRSHLLQFLFHALMKSSIDSPSHPIQRLSFSSFEVPWNDLL